MYLSTALGLLGEIFLFAFFIVVNFQRVGKSSILGICSCITARIMVPVNYRYHCSSTTKAIIDLQLEITASAQRCGTTYSGRCCAEALCQKSIGLTLGDFMTVARDLFLRHFIGIRQVGGCSTRDN
jgi:hypothetical protein